MTLAPRRFAALCDLAREDALELRVRGTCMAPTLAAGDLVRVRPARVYWPGDLVAFLAAPGELTVHRVIGWGPASWRRPWRRWGLWTQADAGSSPDAPVAGERVLGRVPSSPGLRLRLTSALTLARHLVRRVLSRAA